MNLLNSKSGPLIRWVILVQVLLFLSGCSIFLECPSGNCPTDEEVLLEEGAVRLTPDQVRARNDDITEEWRHGGAYYLADGNIRVRWKKVLYNGVWEVEADGSVCYKLRNWQRRCHFYMDKAGEVYLLDEGRSIGVPRTFSGNRLNSLGRNVPLPDERRR